MKFSIEQRIAIGFGLVLSLVGLVSGVSYWSITRFINASSRAEQTQQVLLELMEVLSQLKDAETGKRGYVITGQEAYLAPYYQAEAQVKPQIERLQRQMAEYPEQHNRIRLLEQLTDEQFAELKQTITLRKKSGFSTAQKAIIAGQGKALMDAIRRLVSEITVVETSRLQTQRQQATRDAQVAVSVIFLSCTLAIGLAPIVVFFINRDIKKRKFVEVALRDSEIKLQQTNDRLTCWVGELEQRNEEIVLLSKMNDLLQACLSLEEARVVVGVFLPKLFPQQNGSIFLINASRNLLESWTTWGGQLRSQLLFEPTDCLSLRLGRSLLAHSAAEGLICQHVQRPFPSEYSCIPMQAQGETLGVLHLQSPVEGHLTEPKQQLARTVANQISLALASLKLRETLQHQSIRDPLTGLFNRRYLEESLSREINRAQRSEQSLSVIMVDVDHFKRFNDTFGHEAGDLVLRELGHFLQHQIRDSDIACRYGGEELTLILPDASLPDAQRRAEQLREGVKQLQVQHRQQRLDAISISLGVACFPEHGRNGETLIQSADTALYQAKREGRDRVVTATTKISSAATIPQ